MLLQVLIDDQSVVAVLILVETSIIAEEEYTNKETLIFH